MLCRLDLVLQRQVLCNSFSELGLMKQCLKWW